MKNINEQNYNFKQFSDTFGLWRYTDSEIEYFSDVVNLLMSRSDIKKIFPEPVTITSLVNELKDVVKPSDLWEALSNAYRKNIIPIKPANILFDKIREKKGLTMDYFEEELISESDRDKALSKKAKLSGVPKSILSKVYSKGLAAWRGGHRPGVPQHQWAMGRVNSFLTGVGGARKADADLWAKARKAKARKKKRKSVKEELDILRQKINKIIKETYFVNELKYSDLTSKEKSDYNERNKFILQNKIKPLILKYKNEDVELMPKINLSEDWIEYNLSEKNNNFFSLSMKNNSELNIYLTSKLWDYEVDEFNLGQHVLNFLNNASDYVEFLDNDVIKKVEKVIKYILRKKESYLNQTIKL